MQLPIKEHYGSGQMSVLITAPPSPDLIGLLVSSHHAHGLDEGVAWVVHPSLDGLVQGVAVGSGLITQLGVDGRRQVTGHAVVVQAEVRVLGARLDAPGQITRYLR